MVYGTYNYILTGVYKPTFTSLGGTILHGFTDLHYQGEKVSPQKEGFALKGNPTTTWIYQKVTRGEHWKTCLFVRQMGSNMEKHFGSTIHWSCFIVNRRCWGHKTLTESWVIYLAHQPLNPGWFIIRYSYTKIKILYLFFSSQIQIPWVFL